MRPISFFEGQRLRWDGKTYRVANVLAFSCIVVGEDGFAICLSKAVLRSVFVEVE